MLEFARRSTRLQSVRNSLLTRIWTVIRKYRMNSTIINGKTQVSGLKCSRRSINAIYL